MYLLILKFRFLEFWLQAPVCNNLEFFIFCQKKDQE